MCQKAPKSKLGRHETVPGTGGRQGWPNQAAAGRGTLGVVVVEEEKQGGRRGGRVARPWHPQALTAVQLVRPVLAVFHAVAALPVGDTLLHVPALKLKAAAAAGKAGGRGGGVDRWAAKEEDSCRGTSAGSSAACFPPVQSTSRLLPHHQVAASARGKNEGARVGLQKAPSLRTRRSRGMLPKVCFS